MCSNGSTQLQHLIGCAVPAASVKLMYQPQPQPRQIQALSQFIVTKVACGQNHTLALTKEGQAFTWGKTCMLVQTSANATFVRLWCNMSDSCRPLCCCLTGEVRIIL